MSAHYNNIISIRGNQKDVLAFMHAKELDCDTFTGLTLRSWLPGEDSYRSNIADLGVKSDSEFTEWECIQDDENDTVICGHINTTPGSPDTWLETMQDKYDTLEFSSFSVDEDLEESIFVYTPWREIEHPLIYLDDSDKSELEQITLRQFYKLITA